MPFFKKRNLTGDNLVNKGIDLGEIGKFIESIELFNKALESECNYPETAYASRAHSYLELIRINLMSNISNNNSLINQAIDDCNIAIRLNHKLPNAYKCRAIAKMYYYLNNKSLFNENLINYLNEIIEDYQLAIKYYSYNDPDRNICISGTNNILMLIQYSK